MAPLTPAGDGSKLLLRQGSEGGKSRPLNHMRQIPFVVATQFHLLWLRLRISHIYIWKSCRHVFHVVRFSRYVWACARAYIKRKRSPFVIPNWLILYHFTSIKRSHRQLQCDILTRRQANQGWTSLTMQLLDVFLVFWVTVVVNRYNIYTLSLFQFYHIAFGINVLRFGKPLLSSQPLLTLFDSPERHICA